MIEAMACGTPVIAWNAGSVPEIVDEGVTGSIVDSVDAAVAELQGVDAFDRARVRAVFERRFSVTTMANRYLDLYSRIGRSARPRGRFASPAARALDVDGALRA
jgi:glycosyltransferase involved in cell wall biosynthesis